MVGTSVPTELASNFEPEEMVAAFPIWAAEGNAPAEYIQVDEVADVTVGFIESLLPNKTVGLEILALRSPAPLTGSADKMSETEAVMSPAPT